MTEETLKNVKRRLLRNAVLTLGTLVASMGATGQSNQGREIMPKTDPIVKKPGEDEGYQVTNPDPSTIRYYFPKG